MFDEMQRLSESGELVHLLAHYGQLGRHDRETWQDRLTELQGIQGKELSRLYGELLAHGWIEQNTGNTPILEAGRFGGCYRITSAGQRALRQVLTGREAA
jgi:hypothetical protein